jgi:Zn-finger nucleic acid-binding protein
MKCPRDGTTLARVRVAGIELDKCHRCDGIWCNRGEMERIHDAELSDVEEMLEQKYGNPSYREGTTEGHMRCPCCEDARLLEYTYTYIKRVRIDRCERCFGVWLDDTELDAVVGERREIDKVEPGQRLRGLLRSIGKAFGH